jgi:hypothetical protein
MQSLPSKAIPANTSLQYKPLKKAIKTKEKTIYKLQDKYNYQGLPIDVENKAGSIRKSEPGVTPKWETKMGYDYGCIRNTMAKDKEAVDVFVNKKSKGKKIDHHTGEEVDTDVYIIHQKQIWKSKNWNNGRCPDCHKHHTECNHAYDEDKVMLGFESKEAAIKAYLEQYDSKRFLGPVSTYTLPEFKEKLKSSWGKKIPHKKSKHEHWTGFDLDGTIAKDDGWKGKEYIGEPVKKLVDKIQKLLDKGEKVKIFTARAFDKKAIPFIRDWMKNNNIPLLEITNKKDPGMIRIYDDRVVQVRKNTGKLVKSFGVYYVDLDTDFLIFSDVDKVSSINTGFPGRFSQGELVIYSPRNDVRVKALVNRVKTDSVNRVRYDLITISNLEEIRRVHGLYVKRPMDSEIENTKISEIVRIRHNIINRYQMYKSCGESHMVEKSYLGTQGDASGSFPFLKENMGRQYAVKKVLPHTISEALDDIEKSYESNKREGEDIDDYTRRYMRELSSKKVSEMLNVDNGYQFDKGCGQMKKAFVKAATFKNKWGTTVHRPAYIDKRKKKITHVKHTKMTRLDLSGDEARKRIKELEEKKKHHDLHLEAANDLKEKVDKHKKEGGTHYKVGNTEHHVDKVLSHLDDHIKHHTNEIKSHDNHIQKIEQRHETEAKHWEKKREAKTKADHIDEMIKTGEHKGKKLDKDTISALKKMKEDEKTKAEFSSQKEYSEWYRKQPKDIKESHKLSRVGGKLVATWDEKKPEKKEEKPIEKKKPEGLIMTLSDLGKNYKLLGPNETPKKGEKYYSKPLIGGQVRLWDGEKWDPNKYRISGKNIVDYDIHGHPINPKGLKEEKKELPKKAIVVEKESKKPRYFTLTHKRPDGKIYHHVYDRENIVDYEISKPFIRPENFEKEEKHGVVIDKRESQKTKFGTYPGIKKTPIYKEVKTHFTSIVEARNYIKKLEKTETEKTKTRSEAMMGNQNARKDGVDDEEKKRKPKKIEVKKVVVKKEGDNVIKKSKKIVVPKEKILDFGEKIGGARKDMFDTGLQAKDIGDFSDRELVKHVKKDKIWPKPDYEKLIDNGLNPHVAFLIKKFRDSLPAKMNLSTRQEPKIKEYAKKYIELIEKSRDIMSKVRSFDDMKDLFSKIFSDEHEKGVGWKVSGREPSKAAFYTSKLSSGMRFSNWDLIKAKKAVDKGWGLSKPHLKDVSIVEKPIEISDGKTVKKYVVTGIGISSPEFETEKEADDWAKLRYEALKDHRVSHGEVSKKNMETGEWDKKKGWYATKGSLIVTPIMSTKKEVEDHLMLQHKLKPELGKKKRKPKFTRPQLKGIKRTGKDHRKGEGTNTKDFQKTFGFKGGEFGNWNTQADRQQSMDHASDAMHDLADVLGIDPNEISLDNKLSIAFGARGVGLSGASAHYEPDRKVINLTKMSGAGSLAHEWAHAFDDYIKKVSGTQTLKSPYATDSLHNFKNDLPEETVSAFKDIVDKMKYQNISLKEYREGQTESMKTSSKGLKKTLDMLREDMVRKKFSKESLDIFDKKIVPDIMKGPDKDEKRIPDGKKQFKTIPEKIHNLTNVFFKDRTGRNEKYYKNNIEYYYNRIGDAKRELEKGSDVNLPKTSSNYMKGALQMGNFFGKRDYWPSTVEMFGRAFESYIHDKIKEKGNRSDYLVHSTSNGGYEMFADPVTGEIPKPFPEGKEREEINRAFDKFIKLFKKGNKLSRSSKNMNKSIKKYSVKKVS